MDDGQKKRTLFTSLTEIIVALRIIFAPTVFLYPRFTALASLFLDWIDGEFFKRAGFTYSQYTFYDKILDFYWYVWVLIYIAVKDLPYKLLFIFLFVWRSIGQFLYFKTHKRYLFFIFPNIFEILFFYYLIAVPVIGKSSPYFEPPYLYMALIVITFLVLLREATIHLRKSGVFTGNISYWAKITTNYRKVLVFLVLVLAFVISLPYVSPRKSIYKIQAERSTGSGKVIEYQKKGVVSGDLNQSIKNSLKTYVFNNSKMAKPICENIISPITTNEERTFFIYQDRCLTELPQGTYFLLFIEQGKTKNSYLLEFTVE